MKRKEERRKESGENKYRTAEESLDKRREKKLTQNTEWYKEERLKEKEDEEKPNIRLGEKRTTGYRAKRNGKHWAQKSKETEEEVRTGMVKGVLFIPYTDKSELAKRVRTKLQMYEKMSNLKI